jgi:Tol biopolymer transport system component
MILLPTGPGQVKRLPRSGIEIFYSGGWFPDGQRIFLTGERADRIPRSFIQQVDGSEAAEVGPEGIRVALVSPDGKLLAAYGPDGEHYLLPAGGGELRPIPGTEPGDEMLQWSADGRFLHLRAQDDSRLDFVRLNLSNGRREAWKTLLPPDRVGFIGIENSSGATRVTPDGKAAVYTYWQARGELYIAEGLR